MNRSHTYTFTMYGTISLPELLEELNKANTILDSDTTRVSVTKYAGDQRDGSSTTFTVTST